MGIFLIPTILISQTVSISGKITRHNGDPVPDIEVNCDGTISTDMDGNFEFTDVEVNKVCDVFISGNYDEFEEVTVLDAILIHEYLIDGNSSINGYQFFALDVNNSQSLSSLDIVKVIELALRMDVTMQDTWLGLDEDYVIGVPITSPPTSINVIATDTITDVDFIAIKRGDPAISSDYMPAPPTAPSPIFTISNETFQVGDDVQFEVTVENFSNILGFQQTFKWDPSILEFQSVDGISEFNIDVNDAEIAQGLLPTLSLLNNPQIQDGDVIRTLNFKALANIPSLTEVLFFSDEITARQVVWEDPSNNELFIVEGEYMNGEGTTGIVNAPAGLESFQIFPNPVEDDILVKALLQNAEDYEISIVNVLGQQVFAEKINQEELHMSIDLRAFPAGTYFLSLKTADGIQTESFVKK